MKPTMANLVNMVNFTRLCWNPHEWVVLGDFSGIAASAGRDW